FTKQDEARRPTTPVGCSATSELHLQAPRTAIAQGHAAPLPTCGLDSGSIDILPGADPLSLRAAPKYGPARLRTHPAGAPVPTAGCNEMKLKFETQPTANPTPDADRDAKIADPG